MIAALPDDRSRRVHLFIRMILNFLPTNKIISLLKKENKKEVK